MDPDAPLIVAECVWQYSQHILPGLSTHRGPILTVANWSGTWPGLVGMLNLNGSLTKMGVEYSTLWSEKFTDRYFRDGLRQWLSDGEVTHDQSHVRDLERLKLPLKEVQFGQAVARALRDSKAIMGSSTKAAWACTTPSFRMSCKSDWPIQRAPEPVGLVRSDDGCERRGGC